MLRVALLVLSISQFAHGGYQPCAKNDLHMFEALEYGLEQLNAIRRFCGYLSVTPIFADQFHLLDAQADKTDLFVQYRMHLRDVATSMKITLEVSRQRASVEDATIFTLESVSPDACLVPSPAADAKHIIPIDHPIARDAIRVAMRHIQTVRREQCGDKAPDIQLIRTTSATMQIAQGYIVQIAVELRESQNSFDPTLTFPAVVEVWYVPDPASPGRVTTKPTVYTDRPPCLLKASTSLRVAKDTTAAAFNGLRSSAPLPFRELKRRPLTVNPDYLPLIFDPRLDRTVCFPPRGPGREQGGCGASWAFAATSVAAYRECLWLLQQGEAPMGPRFFAAQDLISCTYTPDGCAGGRPLVGLRYMAEEKVRRESCVSYLMRCFVDTSPEAADSWAQQTSQKFVPPPGCPGSVTREDVERDPCECLPREAHLTSPVECDALEGDCPATEIPSFYQLKGLISLGLPHSNTTKTVRELEDQIKIELYTYGPLLVEFTMFSDFFEPTSWSESGVYEHQNKHALNLGRHAAALVGWGRDSSGVDYWLLLNSWGRAWHDQGYFKLPRGAKEHGILLWSAYGIDYHETPQDKQPPAIYHIKTSYSAVLNEQSTVAPSLSIAHLNVVVRFETSEPASVAVRLKTPKGQIIEKTDTSNQDKRHAVALDIKGAGLEGLSGELTITATDRNGNKNTFGPKKIKLPRSSDFASLTRDPLAAPLSTAVLPLPLPLIAMDARTDELSQKLTDGDANKWTYMQGNSDAPNSRSLTVSLSAGDPSHLVAIPHIQGEFNLQLNAGIAAGSSTKVYVYYRDVLEGADDDTDVSPPVALHLRHTEGPQLFPAPLPRSLDDFTGVLVLSRIRPNATLPHRPKGAGVVSVPGPPPHAPNSVHEPPVQHQQHGQTAGAAGHGAHQQQPHNAQIQPNLPPAVHHEPHPEPAPAGREPHMRPHPEPHPEPQPHGQPRFEPAAHEPHPEPHPERPRIEPHEQRPRVQPHEHQMHHSMEHHHPMHTMHLAVVMTGGEEGDQHQHPHLAEVSGVVDKYRSGGERGGEGVTVRLVLRDGIIEGPPVSIPIPLVPADGGGGGGDGEGGRRYPMYFPVVLLVGLISVGTLVLVWRWTDKFKKNAAGMRRAGERDQRWNWGIFFSLYSSLFFNGGHKPIQPTHNDADDGDEDDFDYDKLSIEMNKWRPESADNTAREKVTAREELVDEDDDSEDSSGMFMVERPVDGGRGGGGGLGFAMTRGSTASGD
ncbi:unnamed protein product [Vitrella brassicaformis CCMP3155]|uniref:Peptidase C1A papain C-terminal domain-containing protein n=2 Tax=Vitrella brassicaformis TaxID=1169539 RepID=A0A0G4G693_VITBC|nr:unnamed protein product [Vitrella brassicaformis CCMP3155]|eukprot:CEM24077.1 unnamed protein product [Vitrella brassicaformis CCMP3155]